MKLIQDLIKTNFEEIDRVKSVQSMNFSRGTQIKQYPSSICLNGDPYKFRGYLLKLNKSIKVCKIHVLITLVGSVILYIVNESEQIVFEEKQNSKSNTPTWVIFEVPLVEVKDKYSIMVNYDGTGNICYQEGNNNFRVINCIN